MLSFYTDGRQATCQGLSRRRFLQVGTLGIGGLTLSQLLAAQAQAGEGKSLLKEKSVVILNLQGGPSQFETFDPKMTAPRETRTMFGDTKTRLPGVNFGSHFPQLAALADKMAIVRCFRHGISSHEPAANHVMAGGNPSKGNMASVFARIAGASSPRTGIPHSAIITPPSVGEEFAGLGQRFDDFITETGSLSSSLKPFDPSDGIEIVENMKLRISEKRLGDRRNLLTQLDHFKRRFEQTSALGGAERFEQQAFEVIAGGMSDAFDIRKEDPRLVARYDTSMYTVPDSLRKKRRYAKEAPPISLGKQLLLARRLVEADCRFVTVTSAGWDMHGNRNNFNMQEGMNLLAPAVDKAASAFIQDLEDRGLSERVLLVILGEFGRTPLIADGGGRGHWGDLCPLIFVGGGLPMGQVIGRSDRSGSQPEGQVVTPANVFATIMGELFDLAELRITPGVPTDIVNYMTSSEPIPQLVRR
ncbi:DUF1501 domain-containing protein [Lignipirellula cremea]|uniref:DUF1501 domain-containing protein n=1 Tax=Lignipirellula cremea TaxID=2528010 RepID=A0A518DKJ6_9BACT|nr:DUF1501 domain-containing protein [Lignipirellula cremea]QDU92355.1 hypothetical protein Pla8534_01010 [Lignipirellula cremea]